MSLVRSLLTPSKGAPIEVRDGRPNAVDSRSSTPLVLRQEEWSASLGLDRRSRQTTPLIKGAREPFYVQSYSASKDLTTPGRKQRQQLQSDTTPRSARAFLVQQHQLRLMHQQHQQPLLFSPAANSTGYQHRHAIQSSPSQQQGYFSSTPMSPIQFSSQLMRPAFESNHLSHVPEKATTRGRSRTRGAHPTTSTPLDPNRFIDPAGAPLSPNTTSSLRVDAEDISSLLETLTLLDPAGDHHFIQQWEQDTRQQMRKKKWAQEPQSIEQEESKATLGISQGRDWIEGLIQTNRALLAKQLPNTPSPAKTIQEQQQQPRIVVQPTSQPQFRPGAQPSRPQQEHHDEQKSAIEEDLNIEATQQDEVEELDERSDEEEYETLEDDIIPPTQDSPGFARATFESASTCLSFFNPFAEQGGFALASVAEALSEIENSPRSSVGSLVETDNEEVVKPITQAPTPAAAVTPAQLPIQQSSSLPSPHAAQSQHDVEPTAKQEPEIQIPAKMVEPIPISPYSTTTVKGILKYPSQPSTPSIPESSSAFLNDIQSHTVAVQPQEIATPTVISKPVAAVRFEDEAQQNVSIAKAAEPTEVPSAPVVSTATVDQERKFDDNSTPIMSPTGFATKEDFKSLAVKVEPPQVDHSVKVEVPTTPEGSGSGSVLSTPKSTPARSPTHMRSNSDLPASPSHYTSSPVRVIVRHPKAAEADDVPNNHDEEYSVLGQDSFQRAKQYGKSLAASRSTPSSRPRSPATQQTLPKEHPDPMQASRPSSAAAASARQKLSPQVVSPYHLPPRPRSAQPIPSSVAPRTRSQTPPVVRRERREYEDGHHHHHPHQGSALTPSESPRSDSHSPGSAPRSPLRIYPSPRRATMPAGSVAAHFAAHEIPVGRRSTSGITTPPKITHYTASQVSPLTPAWHGMTPNGRQKTPISGSKQSPSQPHSARSTPRVHANGHANPYERFYQEEASFVSNQTPPLAQLSPGMRPISRTHTPSAAMINTFKESQEAIFGSNEELSHHAEEIHEDRLRIEAHADRHEQFYDGSAEEYGYVESPTHEQQMAQYDMLERERLEHEEMRRQLIQRQQQQLHHFPNNRRQHRGIYSSPLQSRRVARFGDSDVSLNDTHTLHSIPSSSIKQKSPATKSPAPMVKMEPPDFEDGDAHRHHHNHHHPGQEYYQQAQMLQEEHEMMWRQRKAPAYSDMNDDHQQPQHQHQQALLQQPRLKPFQQALLARGAMVRSSSTSSASTGADESVAPWRKTKNSINAASNANSNASSRSPSRPRTPHRTSTSVPPPPSVDPNSPAPTSSARQRARSVSNDRYGQVELTFSPQTLHSPKYAHVTSKIGAILRGEVVPHALMPSHAYVDPVAEHKYQGQFEPETPHAQQAAATAASEMVSSTVTTAQAATAAVSAQHATKVKKEPVTKPAKKSMEVKKERVEVDAAPIGQPVQDKRKPSNVAPLTLTNYKHAPSSVVSPQHTSTATKRAKPAAAAALPEPTVVTRSKRASSAKPSSTATSSATASSSSSASVAMSSTAAASFSSPTPLPVSASFSTSGRRSMTPSRIPIFSPRTDLKH